MKSALTNMLSELMPILGPEDDLGLWQALLEVLSVDIGVVLAATPKTAPIFVEIGLCSHWLRPHQTRWMAAGGFAWPTGYNPTVTGHGFWEHPALERDVSFRVEPSGVWQAGRAARPRRPLVLRVAVPSRTTRHPQAAVHTVWLPRSPLQPDERQYRFLGFRRAEKTWSLMGDSRPLWQAEERST